MNPSARRAPLRDPAWPRRLAMVSALLVLLWPLLQATEFKPWILLQPDSLAFSGRFLASFWPLAGGAEFLGLLARESWRTVAMATVGVALGWLLAVPLTLLSTAALSISALTNTTPPLVLDSSICREETRRQVLT